MFRILWGLICGRTQVDFFNCLVVPETYSYTILEMSVQKVDLRSRGRGPRGIGKKVRDYYRKVNERDGQFDIQGHPSLVHTSARNELSLSSYFTQETSECLDRTFRLK